MALAIIKIKIMPENLEVDLKKIEKSLIEKCDKVSAVLNKVETQDIAFGLKALVATIGWPEEKSQEELEKEIKSISGVSSTEIIDYRRAIG